MRTVLIVAIVLIVFVALPIFLGKIIKRMGE